jgi:hypothetical protein
MILRINELRARDVETRGNWAPGTPQGPLAADFPAGARAFEVYIKPTDEHEKPMDAARRRTQLRRLLADCADALKGEGEELVVRLDGPLAAGEMAEALRHVGAGGGERRFAIAAARKFEVGPPAATGSMRLHVDHAQLAALLADPSVGVDKSVRLRVFSIAGELVNPLIDADDLDDERWPELLAGAGLVVTTSKGMESILLVSDRYDLAAVKGRLATKLMASR